MPKVKFYAVSVGRDGPNIYTSWDECNTKVSRFPGAKHKSFLTREMAENWLKSSIRLQNYRGTQPLQQSSSITIPDDDISNTPPSLNTTMLVKSLAKPKEQDVPSVPPPVKQEPLPPPAPKIVLSREQQAVLDHVKRGRSVFFTGSAGTGKSVLLREIIKVRENRGQYALAITAATGIASVNIGGTTLHSWAGIGLGDQEAERIVWKFIKNEDKFQNVLKRWRSVKTLIIDEISMIDGVLFDKLEYIARQLRRNELPFGGIQLVLSGDFCQLPPVSGKDTKGNSIPATFAFDAKCWKNCIGDPITLNRVFRQKDQQFVDMLNSMRFGNPTPEAISAFTSLSRKVHYDDEIEPTELFPTRLEVSNANESRLRQLPGRPLKYVATDIQGRDSDGNITTLTVMERLLERLIAPQKIELKVGAQVMLIKNVVQGVLVNGSLGQVTGFYRYGDAMRDGMRIARPEVNKDTDSDYESETESDSSDSDKELDLQGVLDKINKPPKPRKERRKKKQKQVGNDPASSHVRSVPLDGLWPSVRFIGQDRDVLCIPLEFTVDNAGGGVEAMRLQIPLILAWALSVHKSQGQTLERVKVDLRRTFENGQAYVALSRATCMEHLQVLNFQPSKVKAHPRVLQWHNAEDEEDYDKYSDEQLEDDGTMEAFYGNMMSHGPIY